MKKNPRIYFIVFAFLIIPILLCAQQKKSITKKYQIKDAAGDYSKAMLILYSDNTFLNFELINDPVQKEWYIWYVVGKFVSDGNKLVCNSIDADSKRAQIISEIKDSFKRRPDHSLINQSYEFVSETFSDRIFTLGENTVLDPQKKLEYTELQ